MTSDEVIERVELAVEDAARFECLSAMVWLKDLRALLTLAKSRPVEGDVERVVEVWKEETRLDLDEKRNSGLDEFAKGFNYGIREARDLIYRRLPSLLAALPPAGVEEMELAAAIYAADECDTIEEARLNIDRSRDLRRRSASHSCFGRVFMLRILRGFLCA